MDNDNPNVFPGPDSVIPFDEGVDCAFYAKMLHTATRFWGVDRAKADMIEMEAVRRAISLIEAVLTKQIVFKQD